MSKEYLEVLSFELKQNSLFGKKIKIYLTKDIFLEENDKVTGKHLSLLVKGVNNFLNTTIK